MGEAERPAGHRDGDPVGGAGALAAIVAYAAGPRTATPTTVPVSSSCWSGLPRLSSLWSGRLSMGGGGVLRLAASSLVSRQRSCRACRECIARFYGILLYI